MTKQLEATSLSWTTQSSYSEAKKKDCRNHNCTFPAYTLSQKLQNLHLFSMFFYYTDSKTPLYGLIITCAYTTDVVKKLMNRLSS